MKILLSLLLSFIIQLTPSIGFSFIIQKHISLLDGWQSILSTHFVIRKHSCQFLGLQKESIQLVIWKVSLIDHLCLGEMRVNRFKISTYSFIKLFYLGLVWKVWMDFEGTTVATCWVVEVEINCWVIYLFFYFVFACHS